MDVLRFGRWAAVLALMMSLAMAVTLLRASHRRHAGRAIALEAAWVRSKKSLWEADLVVARLSAPRQLLHNVLLESGGDEHPDQGVILAMARD